jgi:hypothetical protein
VILRAVVTVAPVRRNEVRHTSPGLREGRCSRTPGEMLGAPQKWRRWTVPQGCREAILMAIEWGFDGNKTLKPTIFMGI